VSPVWLAELEAATETDSWKHGYAVIDRASGLVVGVVSFKGPPDEDGVVEMRYALDTGLVRLVRAHTLPEPNASTSVLAKCGYRYVGEVMDPEDGLVWRWETSPPG
jgi:[ribosomal protein S5]-alanine N-acetyltransferase